MGWRASPAEPELDELAQHRLQMVAIRPKVVAVAISSLCRELSLFIMFEYRNGD